MISWSKSHFPPYDGHHYYGSGNLTQPGSEDNDVAVEFTAAGNLRLTDRGTGPSGPVVIEDGDGPGGCEVAGNTATCPPPDSGFVEIVGSRKVTLPDYYPATWQHASDSWTDFGGSRSSTVDFSIDLHGGSCELHGSPLNDYVSAGCTVSAHVFGGGGDDYVVADLPLLSVVDGGTGSDYISGSNHGDELSGGPGDDTIAGQQGQDTLRGGPGTDNLMGGDGVDTLDGGDGNDTLDGGPGADLLSGGPGIDIADYYASGGPVNVTLDNVANDGKPGESDSVGVNDDVEAVMGSQYWNDTIIGNDKFNVLLGYGGDDVLMGRGGTDWIAGGPHNDTILGMNGNDLMAGETGNDVVIGGEGNDHYNGGPGADYLSDNFFNVKGTGNDTFDIYDAQPTTDTVGSCGEGDDTVIRDTYDPKLPYFWASIDCETVRLGP